MEENITYERLRTSKQVHFDTKVFHVADLSVEERDGLFRTYGYQMENVQVLDEWEQCLFDGQEIISPAFYIQMLYKIKGTIVPEVFTEAVGKMIKKHAVLRQNFYSSGKRYLKVTLRERSPVVLYRSLGGHPMRELDTLLEQIMEADLRRDFNLATDRLLRLAVLRTGREEYAVIVTQPQLVANGWNIHELFQEVLANKAEIAEKETETRSPYETLRQDRQRTAHGPAMAYWRILLAELPEMPKLPGYVMSYQPYQQGVAHNLLNLGDMENLRMKSHEERAFLIAILQTAWGIMLQQVNQTDDTYFCLVLADRQARLDNIAAMSSLLTLLPVRLTCLKSFLRIEDLVEQQFRQLMISQPYSSCHLQDFQQLLSRSNRIFNHFLSFHGFFTEARRYTKTEGNAYGKAVAMKSRDAQGMDLGVYFHYNGETISMDFFYHEKCFSQEQIEMLSACYRQILHTLLQDWEHSVYSLKKDIAKAVGRLFETNTKATVWQLEEICAFLQQTDFFAALSRDRLQKLAAAAKVCTYLENDTLQQYIDGQRQMMFVLQGKIVRNLDAGNGWFKMLDVLGEKQLLNVYAFLPDSRVKLLAEVYTDKAEVLFLPAALVWQVLTEEPQAMQALVQYLLRELNKYQRYWLMG